MGHFICYYIDKDSATVSHYIAFLTTLFEEVNVCRGNNKIIITSTGIGRNNTRGRKRDGFACDAQTHQTITL